MREGSSEGYGVRRARADACLRSCGNGVTAAAVRARGLLEKVAMDGPHQFRLLRHESSHMQRMSEQVQDCTPEATFLATLTGLAVGCAASEPHLRSDGPRTLCWTATCGIPVFARSAFQGIRDSRSGPLPTQPKRGSHWCHHQCSESGAQRAV